MTSPSVSSAWLETLLAGLLFAGGIASAVLLMAGLGLWFAGAWHDTSELLLNLGLITLMATPVLRVLVSVAEYVRERDWWFVLATMAVLATLGVTIWIAFREAVR
jgi:uncharacterized membrane protein